MDNYPKVKAFMAHMEALPKLAEHIKNRPAADFWTRPNSSRVHTRVSEPYPIRI